MNILLSAYACEPNKGSEPGVGWSWAVELAKHHNVWVITRDNNEPTITKYLKANPEYKNDSMHFIYIGLSKKLTFWKKGRRGMRPYYMMWQNKAARVAAEWHKKIHFDLVQHVTFVSYTQPTYMYRLGIPLVWGPVSGGENIPNGIKIEMSKKEHLVELIRKISQDIALVNTSVRKTMKYSKAIFVTTEETRKKIPRKYQNKTKVLPAIGLEKSPDVKRKERNDEKVKIITAGRLIYWKAFDIGLKAFLIIADKYPNVEFHILGEGNQKKKLQKIAGDKLGKQVFFEASVQHDEIFEFYSDYDLFLNTTLRDSGCMTMMEAMSVGIPCIAIATGGPEVLLGDFEECKILATSYDDCIVKVSLALEKFIVEREKRIIIADKQYSYANSEFCMGNKIKQLMQNNKLLV